MKRCKFPGCDHHRHGRGLCHGHERQLVKGKPLTDLTVNRRWTGAEYNQIKAWQEDGWSWAEMAKAMKATEESIRGVINRGGPVAMCRFPDCTFQAHSKGLCGTHDYQRKKGIPLHAVVSKKDEAGDGLTAVQRRYRRNRAAGLCVTCGKPAREGMSTCRPCAVRAKAHLRDEGVDAEPADDTPRCPRCYLRIDEDHLVCDLPASAAAYAQMRRDGGDANIAVRSKAA